MKYSDYETPYKCVLTAVVWISRRRREGSTPLGPVVIHPVSYTGGGGLPTLKRSGRETDNSLSFDI